MSRLKKELIRLLPEISKDAKCLRRPAEKKRFRDLVFIAKSQRSVEEACRWLKVSRDYFEKWAKRVVAMRSLKALVERSRRPKRSPGKTSRQIRRKILKIRGEKPFLGPERIKHELRLRVAISTIARILKASGLICKSGAKKLTKRHLKRYRRPWPGYLQMDFKYVPYLVEGRQYYQLSCVDHHSSWRMIRIYDNKSLVAVESFFNQLLHHCPFPIIQIQTDNDSAFTDRLIGGHYETPTGEHPFDLWCRKHQVVHKLIPVAEKELNGKVENTHKQDDRELYAGINPTSLEDLTRYALNYEYNWNFIRATKALQWLTPDQTLAHANVRALAWLNYLREKYNQKAEPKKRPKKMTLVDRYIKWAEEDAKKYGNWLLVLPTMSQIFSKVDAKSFWKTPTPNTRDVSLS